MEQSREPELNPHSRVTCELLFFAMIKHYNQGNLPKEEFTWAYGSRKLGVHHGGDAWQ